MWAVKGLDVGSWVIGTGEGRGRDKGGEGRGERGE